ncbi:YafY family protein [Leptotrichia sp. oral taxon 223]|uniref:helix-turn-helix transcriptional regulator n=1 Tax=Leptotrichia sp. oral taxon 223 TaxID=712363 RepID=UPI0015BE908F|nr:YafY family protein [Leptotrichia sp. oral taxon 223]NWO18119.1 YafY family transcriptional regulator [Leptotrichia sp. oral taxon 223]
MKISRLFEIVYLLLEKRTITAKELAAHFEVSARTIYRDIDILSSAGIPVYFQRGKHGGIKLMDNYIMNKSLLSQKEQNEILYALQSLNATNYPNNNKTLSKLSAIFKQKADSWIKIDFSRYSCDNSTLFEKIKEAILTKQTVKFDYFNTKGEHSERTADPLTLWFKEKAWYLFAYCHDKKDIRQFKVSRIKDLILTEKYFEKSAENFKINDKKDKVKIVKVIVEIDKSQAYRVYDEFPEENISKMENGNFEVIMEYPENEWVYGYLLSFGEYLKVKEPERIKKILFEKIEKMKENYK